MFSADHFLAGRTGRVSAGSRDYDLSVVDLGVLHVPSGRLGASDPFVTLDDPLVVDIPPGAYPVTVTVADVSEELDGSHHREAYLSVHLADGDLARVEGVVPTGAPAPEENHFYGVGVDAGTVGFADVEAVAGMPEGDWFEGLFDAPGGWFEQMDDPTHLRAGSANIPIPGATGQESVVLSHSGWGDGFYPVVRTYDAAGTLLGVHIDLLVVGDDEEG